MNINKSYIFYISGKNKYDTYTHTIKICCY